MYRLIRSFLFILSVLVMISCSTKKNTGGTRFFHDLTSHYNILFNGEESYKKGLEKLAENHEDNFNELLPVFLYTDQDELSGIAPEMERAIKKATKLISLHSITAKPEIKPDKELSQKQKEFYNKKEYNRYVDDAYLLMGKAHFYKMEYGRAKETFNYILSNFPEDITVYEGRLWLARLADEEGRYRESEDILKSLSNNLNLPKYLEGELDATWADFYLKQNKYEQAIDPLVKAIDHTRKKRTRTRYVYLAAQLYAQTGDYTRASDYYSKVISMNPPYKMTFSAKINQALAYKAGSGSSRKDIEKQLNKMLRDDKNIEYQDQIYYALGNLYFNLNELDRSIEYYKMSIDASTDNIRQKARTNLTLADIYYDRPDYVSAQAYYDSAVAIIDMDYPNYQDIYIKSVSLNKLVENIRTVEFEDSVLKLSTMPEEELLAFIDNLIEQEIEAEAQRRLEAEQLAQEKLDAMLNENVQTLSNEGGWYFYNPTAKALGKKEFARLWGNRKLEDNWRRKNKTVVNFDEMVTNEEGENGEETETGGKTLETNPRNREYYLQYIPLTDSARAESRARVAEGLYNMGIIYGDDMKDYPEAIKSFETLLSRFPNYEMKLQVYFKLYTIAKAAKDIERVGKYQQKIVLEFPNSNYAKFISNPNYVEEIRNEEKKINKEYENILNLFNTKNYSQAIVLSEKAMKDYPDHELYPALDYIHTVSAGLRKDTLSFIKDLQALIAHYPATDIAENARIMIDYLQNTSPDVVEKQSLDLAREIYFATPDETHYFMYIVPVSLNINQLIFNIVNFNLDNFDRLKLEVKRVGIEGKKTLCVVQKFNNSREAMNYLSKIRNDETIFHDVDAERTFPAVISRSNFETLKETGKADEYILFFRENY